MCLVWREEWVANSFNEPGHNSYELRMSQRGIRGTLTVAALVNVGHAALCPTYMITG